MQFPTQPATIHHHEANPAGLFFAKAITVTIGIVLLWLALCGLVAAMGIEEPTRVVSTGIVFVVIGGGLLYIAGLGLVAIIDKLLGSVTELQRVTWEGRARVEQVKLLSAQTNATGPRSNDEDNIMVGAALCALAKAYEYTKAHGPYTGVGRPWSRNKALGYKVQGLTEKLAGRLGEWMKDEDLLTFDNQINVTRFPSWNTAQRYLNGKYLAPILINNHPTPYQENTSIIDI